MIDYGSAGALTIILPLKGPVHAFLEDALRSILTQTSPDWTALLVTDPTPPEDVALLHASLADARVRLVPQRALGFGAAINTALAEATSDFVCLLLSDDRLHATAVAVMLAHIGAHPRVDFFHSARRYIDRHGRLRGAIMPSRAAFEPSHFPERGSPVKHLLCWRRAKSLEIGGMDEALGLHGCDDYDFPWRMSEAGAAFMAVPDALYEYRVHHDTSRLTTDVSLAEQVRTLQAMFDKHGVEPERTRRYVGHALRGYLMDDKLLSFEPPSTSGPTVTRHELTQQDRPAFCELGLPPRQYFPHYVLALPRCGPDAFRTARAVVPGAERGRSLQIVLNAGAELAAAVPEATWRDRDWIWHEQHLGLAGHIAVANVVIVGETMFVMQCFSDAVQRISRQPRYRTLVDKRFHGWRYMLANAALALALRERCGEVRYFTADLALKTKDRSRQVDRSLFDRIYDDTMTGRYRVRRDGDWWVLSIADNVSRIVMPRATTTALARHKTVSICHDIERDLGHGRELPARSTAHYDEVLQRMLAIEARVGAKVTYHVVARLLPELRQRIEADGHALAFHSFDHAQRSGHWLARSLDRLAGRFREARPAPQGQLRACREIDYRIKGFRPAQSVISQDLSDDHLRFHNFEWLASGSSSLGTQDPRMVDGVVRIPIHFDDFPLFAENLGYEAWEKRALALIAKRDFVAFGLHDCYAQYWLPRYPGLLAKIAAVAEIRTFDDVSAEVVLASSR